MAEGRHLGLDMQLFLLEGERPDLEDDNPPFNIVPRQFTALCSAIADVDLVISADSLPAHLAERAGKPCLCLRLNPIRSGCRHPSFKAINGACSMTLPRCGGSPCAGQANSFDDRVNRWQGAVRGAPPLGRRR
jgi:hypothetical protein